MLDQRSRNILAKFLSLFNSSDQISIANLSEIILFTCGINRVLRLVVEPKFSDQIKRIFHNDNLYFSTGELYLETKDNGWTSINNKPIKDKNHTRVLLVLGNVLKDVEYCFHNELDGDYRLSGKYFNYPDCCINAYPELSSSMEKWAITLLENSGSGPYPCWANRLATGWGGACLSGELFPCNLNCQKAISIGKKTYNCLLNIGFEKLSKEFLLQSLNPVIVRKNGNIEKVSQLNNFKENIISFIQ